MDDFLPDDKILGCQMQSIPSIQRDPKAGNKSSLPLISQARLFFRRHLDLATRRKVKRLLFLDGIWSPKLEKNPNMVVSPTSSPVLLNLQPGDVVRIRSRDEIIATLDKDRKLKGTSFIGGMWQYCGTTQKVFKPINRFVDERNYKVVNTKGLYLLEGVICSGTDFYGSCDRACYFFWREEWLEKQ